MRSPIPAHDCATNHPLAMHAVTKKACLFASTSFTMQKINKQIQAGEVTVGRGSNLRHPACVIDHFFFFCSVVERFFAPTETPDMQQLGTADFGNG